MNHMWRSPLFVQPAYSWPPERGFQPVYYDGRDMYQVQNVYPGMTDYEDYVQDWQPDVWVPRRDEELEAEQDLEYFMGLCPYQVRIMQQYVEQVCDRFEHAHSMLYDEIPDRIAMRRLRNLVLQEAAEDARLFGTEGYFDSPDCSAARDMAEILLNYEVAARRRKNRGL